MSTSQKETRPPEPPEPAAEPARRSRIRRILAGRRAGRPAAPGLAALVVHWAFEGIVYVLRTQRNMQIHVAAAVFVLVMGLLLDLTASSSWP